MENSSSCFVRSVPARPIILEVETMKSGDIALGILLLAAGIFAVWDAEKAVAQGLASHKKELKTDEPQDPPTSGAAP